MGYDAHEYVNQFPSDAVAEIHLGGFTPEQDPATPGAELWIDSHAAAIARQSWDLYTHAVRRFGWKPL
jgi:hypothetical protein